MSSASCPACSAAMVEEDLAGARVDVCTRCAGIWFDLGELARLDHARKGAGPALHRVLALPPATGARRAESCPRCARPLVTEPYPPHPECSISACMACGGMFLAGGELARLRQRPLTPAEALQAERRRRRRRGRQAAAKAEREREARWATMAFLIGVMAG